VSGAGGVVATKGTGLDDKEDSWSTKNIPVAGGDSSLRHWSEFVCTKQLSGSLIEVSCTVVQDTYYEGYAVLNARLLSYHIRLG
jgi:hypothetical protein